MSPPSPLLPELRSLLARLRRRIRAYVLFDGLAIAALAVGSAFWLTLLVDWVWEPSPAARLVLLIAVGSLLTAIVYYGLLRRLFARLGDASMAVLLERRYRQFQDRLLTLVDPANDHAHDAVHRALLERTAQAASRVARTIRPAGVLDGRPLRRRIVLAAAMALSVALFGWFAHDTFGFWVQRMLLTESRWPRKTRLVVEGFPADASGRRTEKVARGGDFDVSILADATRPVPPPREVEVRYRWEDGTRGREAATRIGRAVVGKDAYQPFLYTFKQVTLPLTFDVVGGDDRVEGLQLVIVDRPEIVSMTIDCQYPAYLQRAPRRLRVAGPVEIPEGTRATLTAVANKRLRRVILRNADDATETVVALDEAEAPDRFTHPLPPLSQETTWLIRLRDRDGIVTRQPYRLALRPVPDEPPEVSVHLEGIGTAVTTGARIPVRGEIRDDHGIDRVWIDLAADAEKMEPLSCRFDTADRQTIHFEDAVEVKQLSLSKPLQVGQRLRVQVKAADQRDLKGGPNIGASQAFLLDVVTADQLRSLLERRELMLRRRFETIYSEMGETRDLLGRLQAAARSASRSDATAEARSAPSSDGEASRVARIEQNVQRAMHETLDVATAFDGILQELVNNRIDTEVLRRRLGHGIAEPLRAIGEKRLAELKDKVSALHPVGAAPLPDVEAVRSAIAAADAVLIEMQRVLERMLELESFHEVLEMLRGIIREQEALNEETRKERAKALRGLLGE